MQCYTYDDLDRLVTAFTSDNDSGSDDCSDGYTATGTGPYSRSWAYSSIGNILSWTDEVTSTQYDYDYQGAGPHQVTDYDGTSYTYDANGNQTDRGPDDLHFDHANRLAQYATGVSEFGYDADDVRIVREDPDGTVTYTIAGLFEYEDKPSGSDE